MGKTERCAAVVVAASHRLVRPHRRGDRTEFGGHSRTASGARPPGAGRCPMSTDALVAAPYVTSALGIGGVAVLVSRRHELVERWIVWCVTAVLVGGAVVLGGPARVLLASALGVIAAWELSRLRRLPLWDTVSLCGVVGALPVLAAFEPAVVGRVLLVAPLVLALPAILPSDTASGAERAVSSAVRTGVAGRAGRDRHPRSGDAGRRRCCCLRGRRCRMGVRPGCRRPEADSALTQQDGGRRCRRRTGGSGIAGTGRTAHPPDRACGSGAPLSVICSSRWSSAGQA